MDCSNCPLNIDSAAFRGQMFKNVPLHARQIFICNNAFCLDSDRRTLVQSRNICPRDLWVLAFIGSKDRFALAQAAATLDQLVAAGHSELLCSLFERAGYKTRRELWLRMTRYYPERLYMFDSLFERECLAPLENGQIPANLHVYQHQMLFGSNASQPGCDDL